MLETTLIALPIFAQQKKQTVTPTPSARKPPSEVTQGAPIPSAERGKPSKEQREVAPGGPDTSTRGKPSKEQRQMTGKVISQSGNNFTVMANGKEFTFSAASLKALPKVGNIIDITYTQTPGGPMEATTIKTTKSNTLVGKVATRERQRVEGAADLSIP